MGFVSVRLQQVYVLSLDAQRQQRQAGILLINAFAALQVKLPTVPNASELIFSQDAVIQPGPGMGAAIFDGADPGSGAEQCQRIAPRQQNPSPLPRGHISDVAQVNPQQTSVPYIYKFSTAPISAP